MKEVTIKLALMSVCLILFAWFSYECGKDASDRWYAQHDFTRLCLAGTSADDLASVWNPRGEWVGIMHADGTRPIFTVGVDGAEALDIEVGFVPILYGHAVKLIPPIKVKQYCFVTGGSDWNGPTPEVKQCIDLPARAPEPAASVEEHDIRPLPHAPVILYALDARTCEWGYVDDQREGHMYEAPCKPSKVKLIPPIKLKVPATPGQISIEEKQP